MKNLIPFVFFLLNIGCYGQRVITASNRTNTIILDGFLDENEWLKANWSSEFSQMKPIPGEKPTKKTEVAILYDQEAIYVGAKCYDDPDSIS